MRPPPMRVLTWNLFHGRSVPPSGRSLRREFAGALAGWGWEVALLQEAPPWWLGELAAACGAEARWVLTSRHEGLAVRRVLAERWPDLMRSSGGGANAILVRGCGGIVEHRTRRLRRLPERRYVHAVRLGDGPWVANLHAQAHVAARAGADTALAARAALGWAGSAPLVFGGDLNLRGSPAAPGLTHHAGHSVDHVLSRGFTISAPATTLDHGTLSDHAPLVVDLAFRVGYAADCAASDPGGT